MHAHEELMREKGFVGFVGFVDTARTNHHGEAEVTS
jgi:hypothetical protein